MKVTSKDYMLLALEEAHLAAWRGEVPIGAVIVDPIKDEVIARDGNRTLEKNDPTAHAEIKIIRSFGKPFFRKFLYFFNASD